MRNEWRKVQLGELFKPSNVRLGDHDVEPPVFSVSKYDGVISAEAFFGKRVASSNLSTYKLLPAGEWVYSTIHIDEGSIARNKIGIDGVVSPMYTVMTWDSDLDDPAYVEHLLRSREMLSVYADNAQGSINRRRSLPWKAFSKLSVSLPPPAEQRRIVDLIAAVDDAIAAAEGESDAAELAVGRLRTVGLRGDLIPLGELLTSIDSGMSVATSNTEAEGPRLLRVSAVRHGRFDGAEFKNAGSVLLPARARVADGDILMTRSNTPDRVGFVGIAEGVGDDTYMPDLVWRLVPGDLLNPQYLVEVLSSSYGRGEIEARATGTSASMQKISKGRISSILIPTPSLDEQVCAAAPILAAKGLSDAARAHADSLRTLRSNLLTVLLSGEHEIPATYDDLLSNEDVITAA